tara:strand:+ start:425 stop:640 length:216 start_codon:yes stop_codon:yes gene_type:complete
MAIKNFDNTKLKEMLENSGQRVKFVADKIGVSKYTLYGYLNGYASPSLPVAMLLAQHFNCEIEDFQASKAA